VRRWLAAIGVVTLLAGAAGCGGDGGSGAAKDTPATSTECDWPMWGYSPSRTFATTCKSEISAASAPRLEKAWFVNTSDVVTATPAVVGNDVYVGDWAGRFYDIALDTGRIRWTFDAPVHPTVYSGQIVSSAAVADVQGRRMVFFAGGRTMYGLDATTGKEIWSHDVNPGGDEKDPSEIETSPVVVDGMVIFGWDVHNEPGHRVGVRALDAASGKVRWTFDPSGGSEPTGCTDIWGSPTVDLERRLVFFGTGNCNTSPEGWSRYSEALVALELDGGAPLWVFQPHEPNNDDFDFAGAPNLFEVGGRALVGLGNKDGHYYTVDRRTGALVWEAKAAPARVASRNFSTGGFIGATAVARGIVVGGTAVGGECPCLHGIDAATGKIRWQQEAAGPTFASAAVANDVAFVGGTTDFTLRAVELTTGRIVWTQSMTGAVAGGVAITRDRVVAVAGIREPGLANRSRTSGVTAFRLGRGTGSSAATTTVETLPPTTVAPPPAAEPPAVPGDPRPCVAAPCEMTFELKKPPPGTTPKVILHVRPEPFRLEVRGEGLGDPNAWIRPGGVAAEQGAVTYAVFISRSDDNPQGSMVCVLDASYDCVSDVLPQPLQESYTRVTLLAIRDSAKLPEVVEGFDRLVTTRSFDPPLVLR
jgi:polyvinyl alcohol dehydrogenase (cytochrome)